MSSIEPKQKPCKGINKAKGFAGCNKISYRFKYGLCKSCFHTWLRTTEEGSDTIRRSLIHAKKEVRQEYQKKKKEAKESLLTKKDYLNLFQKVFNTYIRVSKEKECISCNKDLSYVKFDAGHYRSVGANPSLRFYEENIWPQCVRCNRDLHGNLIEYRIRLVKKIGVERVEDLEREHEPKHYSITDLKDLIKEYKLKIKELR